ncbi:hypothetical protein ACLOJK_000192 [Asimina triloba]
MEAACFQHDADAASSHALAQAAHHATGRQGRRVRMEKTTGETLTEPGNGEDDREKRRRSPGMEKTTGETLTAVEVGNGPTGEDVVERERERQGETTTKIGNGEDGGRDADGSRGREWGDHRRRCGERKRDKGKRRRSSRMEKTTGKTLPAVVVGRESVGRESVGREQTRQDLLGTISSVLIVASR